MRRSSLVFSALIAAACHRGGPTESSPAAPEVSSDVSAPAVSPDVSAPAVSSDLSAPAPVELYPVATRDGSLALFEVDGRAYLSMDGEPIALHPGETPRREPALGEGLPPRNDYLGFPPFEVIGLAGDPELPGSAHLVTAEHHDRAGSSFTNYRLGKKGWQEIGRKHEMLSEYYPALATLPNGVVLGLRSYNFDPYDKGEDDAASVEAALSSAPRGFAILAGEPAPAPALPAGANPIDLAGDRNGDLFALIEELDDGRDTNTRLLHWEAGSVEATTLALPGPSSSAASFHELELWSAGDRVFVGGFVSLPDGGGQRPYLAEGEGRRWTRIPVDLPGLRHEWDVQISSSARTDAGELWLTTGNPEEPGPPRLWRQREDSWEPVTLEPVAFQGDASARWVHDCPGHAWVELPPARSDPSGQDRYTVQATTVTWAEGTLWILADAGPAFLDESTVWGAFERRSILYASRPATPAQLPSVDRFHHERFNHRASARALKPGEPGCEQVSVVLLDDPDGAHARKRDAILERYAALDEGWSSELGQTGSLFVGRLGEAGAEQLVLEVAVDSPRRARTMRGELDRLLETRGRADCQIRELVRMIDGR